MPGLEALLPPVERAFLDEALQFCPVSVNGLLDGVQAASCKPLELPDIALGVRVVSQLFKLGGE